MSRVGWIGLVAWACAGPSTAANTEADAVLSAAPLVLTLGDAWTRQTLHWSVSGAQPGDTVLLAAGTQAGAPVCPPVLGGGCLDVRRPVQLDAATADAQGVASGSLIVPRTAVGSWWFQAATTTADVSSATIHEVWDGLIDTDRDGLSDGAEAMVHGTDWLDPDVDGDLVLDGRELEIGTNPFDSDSDADGVGDGYDLAPMVAGPAPSFVPSDVVVSDPLGSMPDPEFEEIEGRFVWQSNDGSEAWTGHVDLVTGDLVPTDGRGVFVTDTLPPVSLAHNGPEWTYTDQGSMLVLGVDDGAGGGTLHTGVWDGLGWDVQVMPGPPSLGIAPLGTLDLGDPDPHVVTPTLTPQGVRIAWRSVFNPSEQGLVPLDMWFARWLIGERRVLGLTLDARGYAQIMAYEPATDLLRQITRFSDEHAHTAYGWRAPDMNDRLVVAVASGAERRAPTRLSLWRVGASGWETFAEIPLPPAFPYVASPEPFIVDGRSYLTYMAQREGGSTSSEQIWVASVDPALGIVRRVSGDSGLKRRDPEPFTLGARPWVFYSEITGDGRRVIHRVETGL